MLNTGCQGAMISRASVGAPWLMSGIQSKFNIQNACQLIDNNDKWLVFIEHTNLIVLLSSEREALAHAKGLVKYYVKRNTLDINLINYVRDAKCITDLLNITQ